MRTTIWFTCLILTALLIRYMGLQTGDVDYLGVIGFFWSFLLSLCLAQDIKELKN